MTTASFSASNQYFRPLQPIGHRPLIRRVFDIEGTLAVHRPKAAMDDVVKQARQIFINWLKLKAYISHEGFAGKSFVSHAHHGYKPAEGIALDGQWAVQLIDDDKQVPERKWMTEFYLDYRTWPVRCCIRQTISQPQASRFELPELIAPKLPTFVRELCDHVGFYDGDNGFLPEPWEIETGQDFENFSRLLLDSSRTRPIFALTINKRTQSTLLNAEWLAHQMLGIAHVVVLNQSACWKMDERFKRDFTVYDGAVRTYQSGFSPVDDEPYQHQLIPSRKIENWVGGPKALEEFLAARLTKACSFALNKSGRLYTFPDFRNQQLIARPSLESIQNAGLSPETTERLELLEKQLNALTEERDFYLQSAIEIETEKNQASKEIEALKAEKFSLLENVRELTTEAQKLKQSSSRVAESYPNSLDKLQEWAGRHWGGKLHFASRAFRAVKDAHYSNVELVYQALELLATEYRDMRQKPGIEAKNRFEQKLKLLGIDNQPTFTSESIANEEGDTYFIDWQGRRCLLNEHIKKGNSHEPRYCLRIYYFWCDETEQVIIGWLPSHLRNRQS